MLAIFLVSFGSCLTEFSDSIGKHEVQNGRQSLFLMGFLQVFASVLIFLALIFLEPSLFIFNRLSLPTFTARAILEVVLAQISITAIAAADRSTYSFIRLGTVPLLLAADVALGFQLRPAQLIGLLLLAVTLLLVFMSPSVGKKGLGLAALTAVMAAVTITLYKYNISHFNSVLAEQLIIYLILLVYFFIRACSRDGRHFLKLLGRPLYLLQAGVHGLSGLAESFAYSLAPASVILTAKRSSAVMCALFSGSLYFKEQHILIKLGIFILLAGGLVLLAL